MNDATVVRAEPAPWHLWLVGVVMLLWTASSCYSHVMTLSENEAYFRATRVTPALAAFFAAVPSWYVVTWTIGVWGGLVASGGLLRRKSWSVWWFVVSQLAMAVNSVWFSMSSDVPEGLRPVGMIIGIPTIAFGVLAVLYSMAMKRRGILR